MAWLTKPAEPALTGEENKPALAEEQPNNTVSEHMCKESKAVMGSKDVSTYQDWDLPPAIAEYFASGRKKIVAVTPNDDFTLTLTFDNEEVRCLDIKLHLLPGSVFEPFMQLENFKRVYLDEQHSICWNIDPNVDSNKNWANKLDICPDCCYVYSIPCDRQSGNEMEGRDRYEKT